jgi:RNA polymerase sigma-70 factor, ECF subfamily
VNAAAPSPEESALARQARDGSASAYGDLVRLHHVRVFGFLLALTRHRQDAEDLTQETFVRAWEKIHHYDPSLPMLPWLLTIARRQSIATLRRSRPLPADFELESSASDPASGGRALWLWEVARRELSADAFSALWLHYREELPVRETAAILGKREGTVKVLLHRARKALAAHVRSPASEQAFADSPLSDTSTSLS